VAERAEAMTDRSSQPDHDAVRRNSGPRSSKATSQPDDDIDDGSGLPRKKRRKLAVDERKRAVKA
jgi:hypothetical protein